MNEKIEEAVCWEQANKFFQQRNKNTKQKMLTEYNCPMCHDTGMVQLEEPFRIIKVFCDCKKGERLYKIQEAKACDT